MSVCLSVWQIIHSFITRRQQLKTCLFVIDNEVLTMLGKGKQRSLFISYQLNTRSVCENHDRGREYKPNSVRSVHMHDRGQGSPIHTDKARLIRCK